MPRSSTRRASPPPRANIGWKRMVDLAKIRKKAKAGGRRAAGGGRVTEVASEEKLQRFLSEVGRQRFAPAAPVQTATDQVELLTFILGGEQFAIDIEDVA